MPEFSSQKCARKLLSSVLVVLLASCNGCDKKPKLLDYRQLKSRQVVDLRTAFMAAMPEFRGTRVLDSVATLRQVWKLDDAVSVSEAQKALHQKGYRDIHAEGTKVQGKLTSYEGLLEIADAQLLASLRLPISPEQAAEMYSVPASPSSEHFFALLPVWPGAQLTHENFEVKIHYEAADEERAGFLMWQLVNYSLTGQWKKQKLPEGWPETYEAEKIPAEFDLVLENPPTGALLQAHRNKADIVVTYHLETRGEGAKMEIKPN